LDIIVYSREQINKEVSKIFGDSRKNIHIIFAQNIAMGEDSGSDAPWGIVSVKPQDTNEELPMNPITMMRNALGEKHGGSGVMLDESDYRKSVEFWSKNAVVK
jgi:hypothetical protein